MIILDTDHVSVLAYPEDRRNKPLVAELACSDDQRIVTTVISFEEQMRGWLAAIHRVRESEKQVSLYDRLIGVFNYFSDIEILRFDAAAATRFEELRRSGVRIGSMDLKIACIALANGAMLLSGNLRDYQRVPGLRVESWLDA